MWLTFGLVHAIVDYLNIEIRVQVKIIQTIELLRSGRY